MKLEVYMKNIIEKELKQTDYVQLFIEENICESKEVGEYKLTENDYLIIKIVEVEKSASITHVRKEAGNEVKHLTHFKTATSCLTTDVEGLVIIDNSVLYDVKTAKFIGKNHESIEALGNEQFFIVDKVASESHHSNDSQKVDYLMFKINSKGEMQSSIYSRIAHDWIAWPVGNKEFNYYNFIQSRKNFLCQLEEKETGVVKKIKKNNFSFDGISEK